MIDAIDDNDTLTNLRRASLYNERSSATFTPSVSQVAPPVKHNFGIEYVSPLFRLQLEPASPSYTGIGKVACICKCVLQDCQTETLKLVSKARVTRRGYLGVGYRFSRWILYGTESTAL